MLYSGGGPTVTSPSTFSSVLDTHAAVIGDRVSVAALNVLALKGKESEDH